MNSPTYSSVIDIGRSVCHTLFMVIRHFLTIDTDGALVDSVRLADGTTDVLPVNTVCELDLILSHGAPVLCSSSIDFPHEFTRNPNTLALIATLDR